MINFKCPKNNNRIKSALAVISILLSAVMLCSCNFGLDSILGNKPTESVQTTVESSTEPKPEREVETSYSYDNLSSDKLRELYKKIDEYAEIAADEYFTIDAPLSTKQLEETVEAYKNDHPEVFWLKSDFEYIDNDDSTSLYLCYSVQPDDSDPDRLKKAKEKFNKTVDKIIDGAPKNATDYELELYVNDYLVENCVYDKDAAESEELVGHENDAYGALVDKKAVCEGYSRAFQLLCNRLGVDCISISGSGDGESHAWNNVKLDGEWYEVDVTWNDTDGDTEFPIYDYFNMPSDKFSESHSTSPLYSEISSSEYVNSDYYYNIFAPVCTGTKYYYYSYSCVTVYDINDSEEITNAIAQAAKDGEKYFDFVIDENLDFDTTSDQIIYNGYLAQWIADANLANWYNPNLNEECYLYRNEEFNVITLILEYI
ncbi:transglutaminase domain-containing protein [uncultured Ruminococcus sp.]|uniref:transglutaminase domain-containing protein n=1 Tax=uncultured Ruminococcus sp. TaxID=165186 RepID=UPI0025DBD184|nr:transglutaminase domain-containing protein [uncultured Ruminococcus sp.]